MDILLGLTPNQVAAVTDTSSPLAVIAPAGSGKTRVLTHRIAYGLQQGTIDPRFTLVVTFTRKAANELRSRLTRMGASGDIKVGTFHALAYAQLTRWWTDSGLRPRRIVSDADRILRTAVVDASKKMPDLKDLADDSRWLDDLVPTIAREISWAKATNIGPHDYAQEAAHRPARLDISSQQIAEIYNAYQVVLARKGVLDFDDVIEQCNKAFDTDPTFANAQRHLLRHVFVDEAQDISPAQLRLIRNWCSPDTSLFLVGDPHQAIYGWSGTDPEVLVHPERNFANAHIIRLAESFRSTPAIIQAASAALPSSAATPNSVRTGGHAPTVTAYDSDTQEAEAITENCFNLLSHGRSPSQIAILVRTRAQRYAFAKALKAKGISASMPTEGRDETGPTDPAVTITTFHAAKGLEWPVVFVCGLEDGLVPLVRSAPATSAAMAEEAEERRLLYVALSRAEDELHCSWARKRNFGGKERSRRPSPWLVSLALAENNADETRERNALAHARPKAFKQPHDALEETEESKVRQAELTRWRRNRARAADVDVQIILPDAALKAAAIKPPRTEAEVAKLPGVGRIRALDLAPALLFLLKELENA